MQPGLRREWTGRQLRPDRHAGRRLRRERRPRRLRGEPRSRGGLRRERAARRLRPRDGRLQRRWRPGRLHRARDHVRGGSGGDAARPHGTSTPSGRMLGRRRCRSRRRCPAHHGRADDALSRSEAAQATFVMARPLLALVTTCALLGRTRLGALGHHDGERPRLPHHLYSTEDPAQALRSALRRRASRGLGRDDIERTATSHPDDMLPSVSNVLRSSNRPTSPRPLTPTLFYSTA